VLTTWGVVLELDGDAGDGPAGSAGRWFALGRRAYFERCPRLAAFLDAEGASLVVTAEQVEPVAPGSGTGGLIVGISAIEVRSSSFDMAVRIRRLGRAAGRPANGRCTLLIQHRTSGERIPLPREIRDEFIAIQLAARELC